MIVGKLKYVIQVIRNYSDWIDILSCRIKHKTIRKVLLRNGISIVGGEKSLTIDIVDEIFVRKVYNPFHLHIKKGDIVVDIGANIGIFSLYAALNGAEKIYSVEPLSENIKYIKNNFRNNGLSFPTCINIAISYKSGPSKLYISNYDSHNLLFDRNNDQKFKNYRIVESLKFSKLLKRYNISKIDFLKIDCEGSEGYIFATINKEIWRNINKVSIEYHNGVSILSDGEITNRLIMLGYKVKTLKSDDCFGYIYAWR